MAVTTEQINSTLADLDKRVEHAFTRVNALWEAIYKKGRVDKAKTGGTYIEKSIMGGSPARGVGIFSGFEVASVVRSQQLRKYQVAYGCFFMPIGIPGKEVRQNDGVQGVIKLVDEYPMAALSAFQRDMNKFMLTGTTDTLASTSASEFYGFTTLNGQYTSGVETGTANGLLDFVATGSQSDTVQSVAKATPCH